MYVLFMPHNKHANFFFFKEEGRECQRMNAIFKIMHSIQTQVYNSNTSALST